MRIISWNTHKTEAGFTYRVISFGYQLPIITLQEGVRPTRAQASARAKKWTLYYKKLAFIEVGLRP